MEAIELDAMKKITKAQNAANEARLLLHKLGVPANSFKAGEKPFWEEQLPKDSGGKITAQLTAQDLAGLRGPEILRLMRLGVIDFASGVLTYMSGDTPAFEGVDLAGLTPDMATTRKAGCAISPEQSSVRSSTASWRPRNRAQSPFGSSPKGRTSAVSWRASISGPRYRLDPQSRRPDDNPTAG